MDEAPPTPTIEQLARDVISLAEDGGMPDSYQQTDQRMIRARAVLGLRAALSPERKSKQ
jgi:hypothetical protein